MSAWSAPAWARLAVAAAALLAPGTRRARFREEWLAELENEARGGRRLSPSAVAGAFADAAALRRIEAERTGRQTMGGWIGGWSSEGKLAARGLARSPLYAGVAVLTLALGIGGSAAIYTLVDRVVLDPLPYPAADRLVRLKNVVPCVGDGTEWHMASAQFFHYGDNAASIEAIGAYRLMGTNVETPDGPLRATMTRVTASAFPLLGARATEGRLPGPDDDRPGAPPVVALSHGFWTRAFGADPGVVGRTISLNDQPTEVVGVLERGVDLPQHPGAPAGAPPDLWTPMQLDPAGPFHNNHVIPMIARLAAGADAAAAQLELQRLGDRLPESYPNAYSRGFIDECGFRTVVLPLKENVIGDMARNLWIVFGAVGLVLVIALSNVASLFLVRLEGRRRELAVRSALGAGRFDLARFLLAESLVLAVAGGALALVVSYWGVPALGALAPDTLPRMDAVAMDRGAVLFTVGLSVAVGIALAAWPILRHVVGRRAEVLVDGARSASPGRDRQRMRSVFVVSQVALALTLAVGAGLLIESLRRMAAVDPGVDPDGVLTVEVHPTPGRYQGDMDRWAFYRELLERVRALPGVRAAGLTGELPVEGGFGCTVQGFEDGAVYERLEEAGLTTCAGQERASPGYFEAMGIPLAAGRLFTDADNDPARGSVVVSRAFAQRFWPGEDPLGKGVAPSGQRESWYRVIGVVGDVPAGSLDGEPAIAIYYPMVNRTGNWGYWPTSLVLVAATDRADPVGLLPAVRAALQDVDPTAPLANARAMDEVVEASMSRLAFTTRLLQVAAAVALLLAALGLYGVVSYVVTRRTREIGMRMALGARPDQVQGLIVGRSLLLAAGGLVLGVGLALALTRVMQGLLFGVEPTNPVAFGGAVVLLAAVTLAASWIPARRASRIDPVEALRTE